MKRHMVNFPAIGVLSISKHGEVFTLWSTLVFYLSALGNDKPVVRVIAWV